MPLPIEPPMTQPALMKEMRTVPSSARAVETPGHEQGGEGDDEAAETKDHGGSCCDVRGNQMPGIA